MKDNVRWKLLAFEASQLTGWFLDSESDFVIGMFGAIIYLCGPAIILGKYWLNADLRNDVLFYDVLEKWRWR